MGAEILVLAMCLVAVAFLAGFYVAVSVFESRCSDLELRLDNQQEDLAELVSMCWEYGVRLDKHEELAVTWTPPSVAEAMEWQPEDRREAIHLRWLDGLKLAEVAEAMGKTPQAVAGLLRRGMASLKQDVDRGTGEVTMTHDHLDMS
jgi:DNA-directed RNA polymerase specialized sigma24 family protein